MNGRHSALSEIFRRAHHILRQLKRVAAHAINVLAGLIITVFRGTTVETIGADRVPAFQNGA